MTIYGLTIESNGPWDNKFEDFPFVYLHGKLNRLNYYDLVEVDELPAEEGIYDVDVILADKSKFKGKLFFWKNDFPFQHGLVVEENDTEALEYAQQCYENKVIQL